MSNFILSRTGAPKTQPVHVLYGGAHLFRVSTLEKLSNLALASAKEHDLATALGLSAQVAERVFAKLASEPVEDLRVDFEDGYGIRPSDVEDADAIRVANEIAHATLPRHFGIRIKSGPRGLRTLRLVLEHAATLPQGFVVTLPKVTSTSEVSTLVSALEQHPAIGIEIMVETPQAMTQLRDFVAAAEGRCVAAHFGAYDYLASLGIAQQDLLHPACDYARMQMLTQLAGTGIWLADGATNLLPLKGTDIAAAWKLHYNHTRRALYNGFYQGWDLHPAQIPARLAAVYSFYLDGLQQASERLRNFVAMSAQATAVNGQFDDAATGLVLLNYFRRALACRAIAEADLPTLTGLTAEQLSKSTFGVATR
jgi:citrate lyase beta subunit